MATGMEMMVTALVKALGLDPKEITAQAQAIGGTVFELKAQLDRIESKLDAMNVNRLIDEAQKMESENVE